MADAGYGSLQNYEYMFSHEITPYVKYNYFHKGQKRSVKNNPFLVQNLFYNKELNFYICPIGQRMTHVWQRIKKSDLGYVYQTHLYKAQNYKGCPMKGMCHNALSEIVIEINHRLDKYKESVRGLLTSETGLYHRSMRPIEPEAVFGHIKYAHGFRRFFLRSLPKVNIEFGLIAIAHNLRKWAKNIKKQLLYSFLHIIKVCFSCIFAYYKNFIVNLSNNWEYTFCKKTSY